MNIAHLIMTYTCPHLTERLIKMISHPGFDFFIHVDKKIDIKPYLYLSSLPNVFLIKNREDVRWAGYNTILATFKCIREICSTGKKYQYINFLSGQDYPLKSASFIFDFFKRNRGKEFLAYKSYVHEWPEGLKRVKEYSFVNFRFPAMHFLEKIVNRILPSRSLPYNYHPYGDSMFWMLSPECALYVTDKIMNDRKLNAYFRYTWGSDEFAFQTVLLNSEYRDRVVNNNYRYIDWSGGGSHPKILGIEDEQNLRATPMLFGRKFDYNSDRRILDVIDNIIRDGSTVTNKNI
ncbi:MAG: beta-1,6-N-acetylglucosaminyltransferase [Niabella sp.]